MRIVGAAPSCRLKELQSAGAQSARRERTADICDAPQDLDNAIVDKNFLKAAKLAFKLRQPGRLLSVVTSILAAGGDDADTAGASVTTGGQAALMRLVAAFSAAEKALAFEYMRDWNTSLRHCHAAQALLHAVLASHSPQVRAGQACGSAAGVIDWRCTPPMI